MAKADRLRGKKKTKKKHREKKNADDCGERVKSAALNPWPCFVTTGRRPEPHAMEWEPVGASGETMWKPYFLLLAQSSDNSSSSSSIC